jgi:hypothetical protein
LSSHVDFVGILFVVWGALTALVGVSTLALSVGAVALITSAGRGGQVAASLTAAAFMTLAFIAIGWGLVHVFIGLPLRHRRPWARLFALILGSIDLLLLPYGTALGCYALWVLLSEPGKALFASSVSGADPGADLRSG